MPLVPELERIRRETDAATTEARALCEGLTEVQLAWRPDPGRWSLAEIFLHLDITTHTFLPVIDRAIEDARRKRLLSDGPFRLGVMGNFYVWYVEPPPLIRLPAPKPLRPLLEGPASDALPRFLRSQGLFLQRLDSANGLDLDRVRIASPFASFVHMSLFALFSVFTGHERRHLWQAASLLRQLPVPS